MTEFTSPPHQESIFDLAFQPVEQLDPIRFRGFHDQLVASYPDARQLPLLPPITGPTDTGQAIAFGDPPGGRIWYFSTDKRLLVQVQHDRLIMNWMRGLDPLWDYPGFDELLDRFLDLVTRLTAELASHGVELAPTRCEFVYDNVISLEDVNEAGGLNAVLPGLVASEADNPMVARLHSLEVNQLVGQIDPRVEPAQTLTQLRSAVNRESGEDVFGLRIATFGRSVGSDVDSLRDAFEACHENSLDAFLQVTDDGYQQSAWGRTDV